MKHNDSISKSFGDNAQAYLTSIVHAEGEDLREAGQRIAEIPEARVLDLGCGAGHLSFVVAPFAARVTAYDLAEEMLSVVREEAQRRGLENIETVRGSAEALPFDDGSFDAVVSRYSAHHWRALPAALKEIHRVLRPKGTLLLIDIAGGPEPMLDTYLQAMEVLRDPSHVRDYSESEWLDHCRAAGLDCEVHQRWRLPIHFSAWVARMRTPDDRVAAIHALMAAAPSEVREGYAVAEDGSFELDALMLLGRKRGQ